MTTSIYEIPPIIEKALPAAASPKSIQNSFKACEMVPCDRLVFSDNDFCQLMLQRLILLI